MKWTDYPDDCAERRPAALDRDDHECQRCGADENLTVRHRTPPAAGGSHELDNLTTICESCHRADRDDDEPIKDRRNRVLSDNRRVEIIDETIDDSHEVDPYLMTEEEEVQYLAGYDHRHEEVRVFRADRIQSVTVRSGTFERPAK